MWTTEMFFEKDANNLLASFRAQATNVNVVGSLVRTVKVFGAQLSSITWLRCPYPAPSANSAPPSQVKNRGEPSRPCPRLGARNHRQQQPHNSHPFLYKSR